MCSDVSLQEPGSGEALSTVRSLAPLVVRPNVHGESWHRHVSLVAVRALVGLLILQGPGTEITSTKVVYLLAFGTLQTSKRYGIVVY